MATLAVTRRLDLTDEQWARLERCCLCPRDRVGRQRGRNGSSSTGSGGGCGSVRPGGTSRTATAPGGRCMRCSGGGSGPGHGADRHRPANPGGRGRTDHLGRQRGLNDRPGAPARRRRPPTPSQQQEPPGGLSIEPEDHALGRPCGGLTTKTHLACEQGQKVLSLIVTAGQRGDSPQFRAVLDGINVPRIGAGRPRWILASPAGEGSFAGRS